MSLPPLACLVGPTAAGKTEVALILAERLEAEIISADSRLLYRGMDIGTAKPSRRTAPGSHHLVDVADRDETWSLAQVRGAVLESAADITARGRLPLMVGGTGQYVRAILEGWAPPPRGDDPDVRMRLEAFARDAGPAALHARLLQVDPSSAVRIDARNVRRVVRALEINEVTGQPASTQRRRQAPPYRILRLGLTAPRAELYARIDVRIDRMLEQGWVSEVRRLMARGFEPGLPSFSAIGYRQIVEVVQGRRSLAEAVSEIRRRTRILVRRQANWFKPDDTSITWFEYRPGVSDEMEAEVRRWQAAAA
jgi:tRNA dimethylallyltransferase